MTGCCTLPPREAPAIPLWINGRPVLAMPLEFNEIRESATQRLIRRVPMVDEVLAASAIVCANQSQRLAPEAVKDFLTSMLQALEELEDHFSGLSAVESHTHLESGKADVANVIASVQALLEKPLASTYRLDQSVLALSGPGMPLSAALNLVLPVVINGGAVTLAPDVNAPSCALALTELCGQCGLPDGLFNVVYVRDPVALQLVNEPGIAQVRLFGPSAWAQRWQTAAMDWKTPCELVPA